MSLFTDYYMGAQIMKPMAAVKIDSQAIEPTDWAVEGSIATGRCRVYRLVGRRAEYMCDSTGKPMIFRNLDAAKAAIKMTEAHDNA